MATNALIGLETKQGIVYRYAHFDGYPEGVGLELLAYKEQADTIVMSGVNRGSEFEDNLSSKGNSTDRILDLQDRRPPIRLPSRRAYLEYAAEWVNFVYLWDGVKWLVADMTGEAAFRPLTISELDLS